MKKQVVKSPKRHELAALRIMIVLGVVSLLLLFIWLLRPSHIGYAPLYWMLIFTLVFFSLKVLHEWYHYFFITVPKTPKAKKQFTVDVLTTYCTGEPYEMVIETLKAIKGIRYPHETYLCDDANDPYMKQVCEELDVHYVTREGRKDAKAGNINNALKQAKGQLCVILDPDHVPDPDFLDPIVPHFNNPDIGYVQIVQAYKNKHESLVAKGAAQQTFQFYGPMMMTMNRYGTVLAIGANCTFRRAALDSIGGHAPGLAEDMHTAMQLHAKGWNSVYVPEVLARGLVPSTLSGYFKQQLKWTRGTFELLIATYPKLFKKLSFRQRLHYGIIPFHYFSGVVFMINFLIPILALLFAVIPLKVDLLQLAYVSFPFLASSLLIRHFVQRWVMEESERGFHVVGGLLQIGTWWINVLGIVYSLLRKEVPYDPTPKDGKEGNPWQLNMPNIAVGLLSLGAIAYGLLIDWNPYSLVMAFLAAMNCSFMVFMLVAGLQPKFRDFRLRRGVFDAALERVAEVREGFWQFRHAIYGGFRKAGLPLVLIAIVSSFYLYKFTPEPKIHNHYREHPFYTGMFLPTPQQPGITDLTALEKLDTGSSVDFNIVSLYLAWGDQEKNELPVDYLEKIYARNSIPMITWEPWSSDFSFAQEDPEIANESKVMAHISEGYFDNYLQSFANQLRTLNRPVFLRFAHEPDNPAYPWSTSGGNTAKEFRKAWRHTHKIFKKAGAENVIWVWNPWSPDAVEDYFPGKEYIDWVGLTALNYADYNKKKKWKSFDYIYREFDSTGIFDYNYPVMLAEYGSLEKYGRQSSWFKESFQNLKEEFPEVRALVLFNSAIDKNIPGRPASNDTLNWQLRKPGLVLDELSLIAENKEEFRVRKMPELGGRSSTASVTETNFLEGAKAVNFRKGKDWLGNYHNLAIREALKDFSEIKKLDASTIKWYGPGVYDRNVFSAAEKTGLQLMYGFWIPDHIDFERDTIKLKKLEEEILTTVKKYRNQEGIVAWNLGNSIWNDLRQNYYKPKLYYQQKAYLEWMSHLTQRIKKADPTRPLTMDVDYDDKLDEKLETLRAHFSQVKAFGVVVDEKDTIDEQAINSLSQAWFYSSIPVGQYVSLSNRAQTAFISSWHDQRSSNFASFQGVVDIKGRHKPAYFKLREAWTGTEYEAFPYEMQIITPAIPIFSYQHLRYQLALKENGQWIIPSSEDYPDLKFEWYLIRTDNYGNPLRLSYRGGNTATKIQVPEGYENYELCLLVIKDDRVLPLMTKLNRPFEEPEFEQPRP